MRPRSQRFGLSSETAVEQECACVEKRRRTHPRLTVHQHAPSLVELGLYKRDGRDEVLQDVRSLCVVDVDLVADEGLLQYVKGRTRSRRAGGTDLVDGDAAAHGGEDAADVVRAEILGIERAGKVSDPEIWQDLVHRHGGRPWERAR